MTRLATFATHEKLVICRATVAATRVLTNNIPFGISLRVHRYPWAKDYKKE